MSTITVIAVAMIIVLASIVYEFMVISRFITEQKLKQQLQDRRAHR
jgi:uncharacterized membrane protein YcjF (UPF0283 family)